MIYFDSAATSLYKPDAVYDAVLHAMKTAGNADRGVNEASLSASEMIFDTRMKLANLFGFSDPTRISFCHNATDALNTAIKGLLNPGDHVITTVLEHNSVLRPLYEMMEKGVEVSFVGCKNDRKEAGILDDDALEGLIRPNTKAIITTHASNLTGNVTDIEKIGALAKKHGLIYMVDASQSAGVLTIDVEKMHIDILCFTGHKSLLGPQGTGGIYVRKGLSLRPLKSGGSGIHTYDHEHPKSMPTALEAGTLNTHGIAGLGASLSFIEKTTTVSIHQRECALMEQFYEGIKDLKNVTIYGDFSNMKNRCPIVSLNIRDYDSDQVGDYLFMNYGISIRSGAHCAPLMHEALGTKDRGAVRFSFSYFNKEEEIDTAIRAICELAEE